MLITAPSSISMIEEIFRAKILTTSITAAAPIIKASGSGFFCIFLIIVRAASKIRKPTAIRIPLKALAINPIERKLSKKREIR